MPSIVKIEGEFPLPGTYGPATLDRVLSLMVMAQGTEAQGYKTVHPDGDESQLSSCYKTPLALIVGAVTDRSGGHGEHPSLDVRLRAIKDDLTEAVQQGKQIIIPVAESKSYPFSPRSHWVTLHYDPKNNTATILDSRPWYVSMLYPTKSMVGMLETGLKQMVDNTRYDPMMRVIDTPVKVRHAYEGAQRDNINCGAWVLQHISNVALGNESIATQEKRYTKADRDSVIPNIAQQGKLKLIEKPGLWDRIKRALGFSKPTTDESSKSPVQGSTVHGSYSVMAEDGLGPSSGKKPVVNYDDDNDDDFNLDTPCDTSVVVGVIEEKKEEPEEVPGRPSCH